MYFFYVGFWKEFDIQEIIYYFYFFVFRAIFIKYGLQYLEGGLFYIDFSCFGNRLRQFRGSFVSGKEEVVIYNSQGAVVFFGEVWVVVVFQVIYKEQSNKI